MNRPQKSVSRRGTSLGWPPLALALLALLVLGVGCESSSSDDTPLTEQYPTVAAYLDMDEDEMRAYIETPILESSRPITIDNVADMTIGARVSSAASSFLVDPIFDIAQLDKHSLLDKNISSSSKEITEMRMVSNKKATEKSGAESYNFSASGSYGGFKASAAYSQDNKRQETTSDGSVSVAMSYNTQGAYLQLLTNDFAGNIDYTPYLIGTELNASEVKKYVDFVETKVDSSGRTYISSLKITNGGQLRDKRNIYGNIQLLGEMEDVFGQLK
ncbi:MAG: hypothetical protein EOM25_11725, partial [Deltaproteobacteria bacterium]|nr:hypothetical protein [Deltaproteobacteria bacterium]